MIKFKTPFPEYKFNKIKIKKISKMAKPLIYAFAIFGFASIIVFISLVNLIGKPRPISIKPIPKNAIVSINFNHDFNESKNNSLLTGIKNNKLTYFDLIKNLNIALLDDNVKAIIGQINTTGLGLSQIQNIQKTINNFKQKGKKTHIFSSGMGSLGQGTDEYFLASAFDKIYMQPNSDLGITGIGIEIPFFGNSLNKLGIDAEIYTRHEYKNAASSLTHGYFPHQYKQQLNDIGNKIYNIIVETIAQNRNISINNVKQLINTAPLSAEEALQYKLIDEIAYYSDVEEKIKKETNGNIISLEDYATNFSSRKKKLPSIAILNLEGTIVDSQSPDNIISEESIISPEKVAKSLENIAKNPNIKALILRINSPGGSYTASNTIWYELTKLKQQKNIPIVVSMGDYAASGGYFIALSGDKILAEPLTLTGSIGVLGGKIVTANLWKKLGVNWGNVQFGNNAGIVSSNHNFSSSEKQAINKSLDNIYNDFIHKVSSARNIEIEAIDKVARGRVWLGIDAVENGIIDELGGLDKALQIAKQLAGISPKQNFDIITYPKPKSFAEQINEIISFSPQISINQLATKMGLDIQDVSVLKQMQYDCIITPFIIKM